MREDVPIHRQLCVPGGPQSSPPLAGFLPKRSSAAPPAESSPGQSARFTPACLSNFFSPTAQVPQSSNGSKGEHFQTLNYLHLRNSRAFSPFQSRRASGVSSATLLLPVRRARLLAKNCRKFASLKKKCARAFFFFFFPLCFSLAKKRSEASF